MIIFNSPNFLEKIFNKMGKILQRIKIITENEGITVGKLERIIGASKGVLSRAVNNETDIQSKWLEIIAENYPQYSAEWLMRGEGSMLKTDMPDDGTKTEEETASDGVTAALERIIQRQAKEIARLEIELEKYRPDGGGQ